MLSSIAESRCESRFMRAFRCCCPPLRGLVLLYLIGALAGCGVAPLKNSVLLGENEHFAVVVAGEGESYEQLAEAYYRDPTLAWRIEDANGGKAIRPGDEVVIPKRETNRTGVSFNGYQTIPILSYHRFGNNRGRLSVSRAQFEEQMSYLKRNGYQVVALRDAAAFFRGERSLPRKSVVLTIDDGYQSAYRIAYPVLAKYGFPATVFIYSDYIGRGGLTWAQMREMEQSGLFTFQPHSHTHANLTLRKPEETLDDYRKRLGGEVEKPGRALQRRLANPVIGYAYPFGAVNRHVVDELKRNGYELGATVRRGSNPFFAFPFGLRRTMIYQADDMDDFAAALNHFERL